MPPFTTNTIYYDPLTSTTTTTSPTVYTTVGPTSISFSYDNDNTKEQMKEYCDKVDQHVDKLEEDIDFLNNQRISHDQLIKTLIHENIKKDNKIKDLTDLIESLKSYINDQVRILEERINADNA